MADANGGCDEDSAASVFKHKAVWNKVRGFHRPPLPRRIDSGIEKGGFHKAHTTCVDGVHLEVLLDRMSINEQTDTRSNAEDNNANTSRTCKLRFRIDNTQEWVGLYTDGLLSRVAHLDTGIVEHVNPIVGPWCIEDVRKASYTFLDGPVVQAKATRHDKVYFYTGWIGDGRKTLAVTRNALCDDAPASRITFTSYCGTKGDERGWRLVEMNVADCVPDNTLAPLTDIATSISYFAGLRNMEYPVAEFDSKGTLTFLIPNLKSFMADGQKKCLAVRPYITTTKEQMQNARFEKELAGVEASMCREIGVCLAISLHGADSLDARASAKRAVKAAFQIAMPRKHWSSSESEEPASSGPWTRKDEVEYAALERAFEQTPPYDMYLDRNLSCNRPPLYTLRSAMRAAVKSRSWDGVFSAIHQMASLMAYDFALLTVSRAMGRTRFRQQVPLLHRSRIDVDSLQPPLQMAARVSQLCPNVIDARTTHFLVYHLEALRRAISDIEGQLRRDRLHVYKGYWIMNSRLLAERVLHIYQRMQESPASADLLNLSCKDAGMTFEANAYGSDTPSSSEESTLLDSLEAVAARPFPVHANAPTPVETRHDPAPEPTPEPEQTRKDDGVDCGCLLCLAQYHKPLASGLLLSEAAMRIARAAASARKRPKTFVRFVQTCDKYALKMTDEEFAYLDHRLLGSGDQPSYRMDILVKRFAKLREKRISLAEADDAPKCEEVVREAEVDWDEAPETPTSAAEKKEKRKKKKKKADQVVKRLSGVQFVFEASSRVAASGKAGQGKRSARKEDDERPASELGSRTEEEDKEEEAGKNENSEAEEEAPLVEAAPTEALEGRVEGVKGECAVCFYPLSERGHAVSVACGHAHVCQTCAPSLRTCVICRKETQHIALFL